MTEPTRPRVRDRLARLVPTALLSRVRWLFLVFILLSATTTLITIADLGPISLGARLAGAAAVLVWVLWAWLRFRRPEVHPITDLIPIGAFLVLGLVMGSADWVFVPTFATLYYRAMFGTRRQVIGNSLLYFATYAAVATFEHGSPWWSTLAPSLFLFSFVAIALVMQALGGTAAEHEASAQRERILTDASSQLLRAESVDEVHRVAAESAFRIAGTDDATVGVWVGIDVLEIAATAGPRPFDVSRVPLGLAPPDLREPLTGGRPYVLGRDETRRAEEAFGQPARHAEILAAPLTAAGELHGVLIVTSPIPIPRAVLEVMERFANEVSLAGDRARLVAELERTNEELRRADEIKNRFLSTVSHELRAPLTSICGFAHTLRERWQVLTDAQREQALDVIHRQGLRQTRLVEDLLMTSRLASGDIAVRPERTDVLATVEAVAVELALEDDVVTDVVAGARWVWADPFHLARILTNLLTNAARYGMEPFEVRARRDGDEVRIDVIDHGSGVPDSFRPHLFEPFRRADAGDGPAGGVGLGLSIVHQLAIANGGDVAYVDTPGIGAHFRVQLQAGPGADEVTLTDDDERGLGVGGGPAADAGGG